MIAAFLRLCLKTDKKKNSRNKGFNTVYSYIEQTHNWTRYEQVRCTTYVSFLFNLLLINSEFYIKIADPAYLLHVENSK